MDEVGQAQIETSVQTVVLSERFLCPAQALAVKPSTTTWVPVASLMHLRRSAPVIGNPPDQHREHSHKRSIIGLRGPWGHQLCPSATIAEGRWPPKSTKSSFTSHRVRNSYISENERKVESYSPRRQGVEKVAN